MNYVEFGKEHADVIVLLHGGGLSWWNYRKAADILGARFHVILPILDGHAGSGRSFTSIEANARDIIAFIDVRFGGSVLMIGGLSLGGQILIEILSQRGDICRYALIESALVLPSAITRALIKPAFGSCCGLIRRKWFARLQFRSLGIDPALFDDYYRDTCAISKPDMIAFLEANAMYSIKPALRGCSAEILIVAGANENRKMRRSAELLHKNISGSTLRILPKMRHGDLSINHPAEYAACISELIAKNKTGL